MEYVYYNCVKTKIGEYGLYWKECVLEDNVEIFKILEDVLTEGDSTKRLDDLFAYRATDRLA